MILVDTTPLVALCDPREPRHERACEEFDELLSAGLVVCEAVLVEACFHLPHRAQRQRLRALLEEFLIGSPPTHEPEFHTEVFDWLLKYADHEPDWADASLAVLAGRHRKSRVWTYDREFRTVWRRPDGRPVPLAVE